MLERGANDLFHDAHPALARLRPLNFHAACELSRSTEPEGPVWFADAECQDYQKLLAWRRSD